MSSVMVRVRYLDRCVDLMSWWFGGWGQMLGGKCPGLSYTRLTTAISISTLVHSACAWLNRCGWLIGRHRVTESASCSVMDSARTYRSHATLRKLLFLSRDAMIALYRLCDGLASVCVCVCLSQVLVLSKRLNELSWFSAWELRSTYPTLPYTGVKWRRRVCGHDTIAILWI